MAQLMARWCWYLTGCFQIPANSFHPLHFPVSRSNVKKKVLLYLECLQAAKPIMADIQRTGRFIEQVKAASLNK